MDSNTLRNYAQQFGNLQQNPYFYEMLEAYSNLPNITNSIITERVPTGNNTKYKTNVGDDELYQYGEYREPYQSELDYFKNNTNVAGMATEDNKIILNPYSSLSDEEMRQVGLNEGVRLFLRNNPNYIGNFGLTKQQKQSFGNYSNNIDDIRSTILARILTKDPSVGKATIRQKFNANRVRNAINRGLE